MNVLFKYKSITFALTITACALSACEAQQPNQNHIDVDPSSFAYALSESALARTRVNVRYDGSYKALKYPGGDVASNRGVCSDVVVRAYRALGIDLQLEVHEDMSRAFGDYPDRWGLVRPDSNIDHRRVPNLETFFTRMGASLPIGKDADYQPGDIVSWRLPNGAPHIGIVHSALSQDGKRPLVVHNIGLGPVLDDSLFRYPIYGHFRYHNAVDSE